MKLLTSTLPVLLLLFIFIDTDLDVDQDSLVEKSHQQQDTCSISITHEQLKAEKTINLSVPQTCDSTRFYVPSGGTITHAGLYLDSTMNQCIAETPAFDIMNSLSEHPSNYMMISNQLKGRFFLNYGSCHWGSNMWIEFN